jgi:hypothetical protein
MTDFSNIGTVYTKINTGYPKFGEKNQNRLIFLQPTEFLNTAYWLEDLLGKHIGMLTNRKQPTNFHPNQTGETQKTRGRNLYHISHVRSITFPNPV